MRPTRLNTLEMIWQGTMTILFAFRTSPGSRRPGDIVRRGLTLIELLMVMVIMAIMLSIAVPAFNSMGRGADLRGAVSGVRAMLAQSRQWAITHRELVTFYYQTSYYYACDQNGLLLQATNYLPSSVTFNGTGEITFKTDGSLASRDVTKKISLTREGGAVRNIEILGLTGGIKVQ